MDNSESTPNASPKLKTSSLSFLTNWKFLAIVGAFALLAIGGILLLRGTAPVPAEQPVVADTEETVPPPAPSPQPQTLDTPGWQTYVNDKYKYFVQYPIDWEIGDVFVPSSPKGVTFQKITKRGGEYYNHASVRILIEGTQKRSSLKEKYVYSIKALGLGYDADAYRFKETTFLGYNGLIVNDRQLVFVKDTSMFIIDWSVNGNYDDEFVTYAEQVYNQILSTFRFIE